MRCRSIKHNKQLLRIVKTKLVCEWHYFLWAEMDKGGQKKKKKWNGRPHRIHVPIGVFKVLGLRIILSKMPTIWSNLGRSARSFCQQSNMSWWRPGGQSMGAGRRYPSSIAFMTCKSRMRDGKLEKVQKETKRLRDRDQNLKIKKLSH